MKSKKHFSHSDAPPLAYSVNGFCAKVPIGRTSVYELIKQGKLKSVVVAGRRLIPATEAQRLLGNTGGANDAA